MNKRWYRHKRYWLALLALAYLLAGFFYLPTLIPAQLNKQLQERFNMSATIDDVSFNPLTFVTELSGIAVTDRNQHPWLQATQLRLNFDPSHLIWGQWQVSELSVVEPVIEISTSPAGQLLVPQFAWPEPGPENEAVDPNYAIANITITGGSMNLKAGQISQAFALNIKQLDVRHEQFNPNDIDTAFAITIITQQDEQLRLNGHYNHPQATIRSDLELSNWQSATLLQLKPDNLALSSDEGLLSANGTLSWALSGLPVIKLAQVEWQNWHLNWSDQVQVDQLNSQWQGLTVDASNRLIHLQTLNSEQANWRLNWPIQPPEPSSGDTTTNEPNWRFTVDQLRLTDWPFKVYDQQLTHEFGLTLKQLALTNLSDSLHNINQDSLWQLDQGGDILINAQTGQEPGSISAQLDIKQLNLPSFSPWVAAVSGVVINRGTLNSQQRLNHDAAGWQLTGQVMINDAQLNNTLGQEVATIGGLEVGTTQVDSRERSIVIDQITLDQAQGNLIIDPDRSLNIQHLGQPAQDTRTHESPAEPAWRIDIGAVEIRDTQTALIDQSTDPPVTTRLSDLNGAIKGLSSVSLSRADVDLSAKFNQYSPVSIAGQINPLSTDAYTRLDISINDLDLPAFSPYAEQWVAFPILGGKLDLNLQYTLNQAALRGNNTLLFKQFKLGERQDAPDAIDLPLKLAVSLLTNGKGEMHIDLPVSGNLDDPEFSYGSLVGKAIFKLITNIVASPFKILGALIPNPDPNLSDIGFQSGSAELQTTEQHKLSQIAAIMQQKPDLNLRLNPFHNQAYDQEGLQRKKLLAKAPFAELNLEDEDTRQWLAAQLTVEELDTHRLTDGSLNHRSILAGLLQRQVTGPPDHEALTQARLMGIKDTLVQVHGIPAERIFIEQSEITDLSQALVRLGVSQ